MRLKRIGGIVALAVALVLGLALSLGLWSNWTASAQTEHVVNSDTGAGDPEPCNAPDFASVSDIETVIDDDANVADGDTLVLCPGTYDAGGPAGAIDVNKALTIEGLATADRDDIVVHSASNGITISTDGVTLRHFKLTGEAANTGIQIQAGANGNTIQDLEIRDWLDAVVITDADDNLVADSNIHQNADDGVDASDGAKNVIRHNEIADNTSNGIDLDGEDQALLEDNTLSGNGIDQISIVGKTQVLIYRNQIDTASDGIYMGNLPAEAFIQIGGSAANANTFTGPFGDPDYYVQLHCSAQNTVDATYNWWGSAVRLDIANRIFNDEDDPGGATGECIAPSDVNGAVVFHPWATEPAPTVTPTPTPTPVATGTPTPTPGNTRTIPLTPPGWYSIAWSGADATDADTALACIAGKFSIAYRFVGATQSWERYVPPAGNPLTNIETVNKYDSLLVLITAAGTSCEMPVE